MNNFEHLSNIPFTKMSGTGNDFIIIDNRDYKIDVESLPQVLIQKLCSRHFGVGADGLVLIENSHYANFKWNFFNQDGQSAEMCGNASRCVARFAYDKKIVPRKDFTFETLAGIIHCEIKNRLVKIRLTSPKDLELNKSFELHDQPVLGHFVNTGVPHVVIEIEDLNDSLPLLSLGEEIRHHDHFQPKGTNVTFFKRLDSQSIQSKSFERGVEDITLACGTGASAAAIISYKLGYSKPPTTVFVPGGQLDIAFTENLNELFLTGSATYIYEGHLHSELFL